jgi:hypothetical protein
VEERCRDGEEIGVELCLISLVDRGGDAGGKRGLTVLKPRERRVSVK